MCILQVFLCMYAIVIFAFDGVTSTPHAGANIDKTNGNGNPVDDTDQYDICVRAKTDSPQYIPCEFIRGTMQAMLGKYKEFNAQRKRAKWARSLWSVEFERSVGFIDDALIGHLSGGTIDKIEKLCQNKHGLEAVYRALDKFVMDAETLKMLKGQIQQMRQKQQRREIPLVLAPFGMKPTALKGIKLLQELYRIRARTNRLVKQIKVEIVIGQSRKVFYALTQQFEQNRILLEAKEAEEAERQNGSELNASTTIIQSLIFLNAASKILFTRLAHIVAAQFANKNEMLKKHNLRRTWTLAEAFIKPEIALRSNDAAESGAENSPKLIPFLEAHQEMPWEWFAHKLRKASDGSVEARIALCTARVLLAYERMQQLYGLEAELEATLKLAESSNSTMAMMRLGEEWQARIADYLAQKRKNEADGREGHENAENAENMNTN